MSVEDVKSRGSWMQTYTNKAFYPLAPHPDDIDIEDIAHGLSMLCRYNGHVKHFYSVAEHCILLSEYFVSQGRKDLALAALLHDAPEAYIGDMIRPLKIHMPDFQFVDDSLTKMIYEKFGVPFSEIPPEVKEADTRILLNERAVLKGAPPQEWDVPGEPLDLPNEIEAMDWMYAEEMYLYHFNALTKGSK